MESLLADVLGGAHGGVHGGGNVRPRRPPRDDPSLSSRAHHSEWTVVRRRNGPGPRTDVAAFLAGSKRRRCSLTAVEQHPPRRRKTRSRTRAQRRLAAQERRAEASLSSVQHTSLSLPITTDSLKLMENLKKVSVISTVSGQTSVDELQASLPRIFGLSQGGKVSQYHGNSYLISFSNEEEARSAEKLHSTVDLIHSKHGPCRISLSPWTPEFGSVGEASGIATWVTIWNLPLHCWCWSSVVEVVKPIGDLVSIEENNGVKKSAFIVALVRLRKNCFLPLEVELSVGMRKYLVLIVDSREPAPVFRSDLDKFVPVSWIHSSSDRLIEASSASHSRRHPSSTGAPASETAGLVGKPGGTDGSSAEASVTEPGGVLSGTCAEAWVTSKSGIKYRRVDRGVAVPEYADYSRMVSDHVESLRKDMQRSDIAPRVERPSEHSVLSHVGLGEPPSTEPAPVSLDSGPSEPDPFPGYN